MNFPSIDAGKPGHVVITFPGTTVRAASAFRPWNYYFVVSTNALDPIPTFLSTTANVADDPIHRGACQDRCAGMFDFLDAIVAPTGEGWGAATDTCTKVSDCITNNGPNVPGGGVAPSALGVAVRQVAGPALRGPDRDLAPSLSATGENQSLRIAGLISLLSAILLFVAVRRSRQA